MPEKRQTSKQRRAARNRAYREAMIARRENAQAERERARQAAPTKAAAASRGAGGGGRGGGTPSGPPVPGLVGAMYRRGPAAGDTAVALALVFAVLAAGVSLYVAFTSDVVPVDHAGDPLGQYPAVSRVAYAIATGTEPVTDKVSLVDAYGPVIAILALFPALVMIGVFFSHRREVRSRPLTFGLIGLALISVFNGFFAVYFLPALVALAVAGFQVRKTEMPARAGGLGARGRQAEREDEDVIEVDEVDDEVDDDEAEEWDEDEEAVDVDEVDDDEADEWDEDEDVIEVDEVDEADDARPDDAGPDDAGSEDVLAELEAEVDDEADGGSGRRGRGAGGRSSRR